jgi:hypothetical protein
MTRIERQIKSRIIPTLQLLCKADLDEFSLTVKKVEELHGKLKIRGELHKYSEGRFNFELLLGSDGTILDYRERFLFNV